MTKALDTRLKKTQLEFILLSYAAQVTPGYKCENVIFYSIVFSPSFLKLMFI